VDIVTLDQGGLDITVRPLAPHERLLVQTMDAEVEVRGTMFRVEADAGRIRSVGVTAGKVEVRYLDTRSLISPGGTWRSRDVAAQGKAPSEEQAEERACPPAESVKASGARQKARETDSRSPLANTESGRSTDRSGQPQPAASSRVAATPGGEEE